MTEATDIEEWRELDLDQYITWNDSVDWADHKLWREEFKVWTEVATAGDTACLT